ncbi:MAG: DUF5615 family PIN-like protein [Bacteroidota bacterium]
MKLLLDENLPHRLRKDLAPHEVSSVNRMKWNGKKNGELLQLLREHGFEVLLTFDRNMQYQQNLQAAGLMIVLLKAADNAYLTLQPLMLEVLKILSQGFQPGIFQVDADEFNP